MPTAQPPHFLIVQADQLSALALGLHGGPAITPNLDRLAENGVVFDSAYCNFPLCAPSRFSMLAGMLPSRIGAYDNGAEFRAGVPTLAHHLRLAGYRTVLAGKQHFVGPDQLHGFDERLLPELYPVDFAWTPSWDEQRMESNNDHTGVTRAGVCRRSVQLMHDRQVLHSARACISQHAMNGDGPLALVASFTHPHEPYYCLAEHHALYRAEDIPMPVVSADDPRAASPHTLRMRAHHGVDGDDLTAEHVRTARHAYYANVTLVDEMLGELLQTLEECNLADNTVIVFTADHGDMLGEHGLWFKKTFLEPAARVPLLVYAPGRLAPRRVSEPVSLLDLVPTLNALATDDTAEDAVGLDGRSLLPLATGETAGAPVLAEITSEGVTAPMFMVRDGDWKLVTGGGVPDQLFNLAEDPHEVNDRIGDSSAGAELAGLRAIADATWDPGRLDAEVRLSQKRRRLVRDAHRTGAVPDWTHRASDPVTPLMLRGTGGYNDWAWLGIEGEN